LVSLSHAPADGGERGKSKGKTTFSVLCHEGTHYYQGLVLKNFSNIPIWLVEGMAVYFGDGSIFDPKKGTIKVGLIPRDRLAHIQDKMARKAHTPVKKLVTMTRRRFSGSHYADAWSLIYFLVKSSKKGEALMTAYWSLGLERQLNKDDFLTLAKTVYGSVEELEKQYVEYILALDVPSAGKVVGDYFVSDIFQFDFKAPSDDWVFFEDPEEKRMLVGLYLPRSSAEIRIYYDNNMQKLPSEEYLQKYIEAIQTHHKNLEHEPVKISNLDGYRLEYTQRKKRSRGKKTGKNRKTSLRAYVGYLLIQTDGVVTIQCSSRKRERSQFAKVFDTVNELFTLSLTRRW
jgi:hypothetical protein